MIFSTLLAGALALPLAVQASHGGTNNNHRRHHADLAARVVNTNTTAEVNTLEKRAQFSNARFTYYDITTGQCVAPSQLPSRPPADIFSVP
jgi:hypothetical protein